MISEKIIKTKFYKSFTHTSINIDKVPMQIKITFEFYWDSINEKTILLIILRYEDEFFDDLVRQEFTEKDQINICKIFAFSVDFHILVPYNLVIIKKERE